MPAFNNISSTSTDLEFGPNVPTNFIKVVNTPGGPGSKIESNLNGSSYFNKDSGIFNMF